LWPGFGGVGENVVDAVGETRSASDWSHHCDLSQRMPAPTPDPSPRDKKPVNKKQLAARGVIETAETLMPRPIWAEDRQFDRT
jgi:hypothetical protein